jgi:hypothetical protein
LGVEIEDIEPEHFDTDNPFLWLTPFNLCQKQTTIDLPQWTQLRN